jgi:hypothetical protein
VVMTESWNRSIREDIDAMILLLIICHAQTG